MGWPSRYTVTCRSMHASQEYPKCSLVWDQCQWDRDAQEATLRPVARYQNTWYGDLSACLQVLDTSDLPSIICSLASVPVTQPECNPFF